MTCSLPLRVVDQLHQGRQRNTKGRIQLRLDVHLVNGGALADGYTEAGLAVGDERDARLGAAARDREGPGDARHLGVHQRRLGDAGVSGHRLKLHPLLDGGYALGGDGSLDGPRTPAQGDDPQVAELPVDGRKGVRDLSAFDGDGPGLPQRVLPREGEGRVRAVQGEGVVDALPLVQGGRTPEPQPAALRPAEGADADVKGGGRSERDGGPVAGDRRRESDGGRDCQEALRGLAFAGTSGSRPRCRFR